MGRWVFVLVTILGGAPPPLFAQPDPPAPPDHADAQAVRATIDALFDGMRAGDAAAVRAVFHDEARLHTAHGASDTSTVRTTPIEAFVEAVGRPREAEWDERIWDVEIRVDGPLASAWVPYAFYRGDALSHCGTNVLQLVKQADGWRILQLTDTRRERCSVPAEVRK